MSLAKAGVELLDCVHKTPKAQSNGMPYISIPQMKNGELDPTDARRISHGDFVEWTKKALPKRHDVVLSRRCNPGETAYVRGDFQFALGQNLVLLRSVGNHIAPEFLRWLVRSPGWWENIDKFRNVGAVFDSLRCADVPNFELLIPPLPEQQAIARILSALDDKIELNRRMNETLEAITRAIFKDWFVDFGPTRAKQEGRAAYLPEHLWSLFPEAIDPETGIPTGWKLSRLDELVVLQRGFDLPKSKRQNGNFPVIAASGFNGTHNEYMVEPPGVTTGRSGVLGKVFYIQEKFWPLNTSLWIKQYIDTTPIYAYFLLQNIDFSSFNAGSAVPTLNRNHIHNLFVPKPNIEIIREFSSLAENLFNLQYRNSKSSDDLADLRDRLLPKLMSGEIRVKDAEKLVEEAV
ncbi:hypothetical protein AMR42_10725 [Limnothrix sp. PR1529]|uniref:restriction endonuclease subunit S n=1 Tax=Limnothrix sp. PR1529 TaxID=1704291 RepID=UPI000C6ABF5A|nr:restriction endonuclease subunit S [Limnothrix sp. PR1529]PIB10110.1 hypothetical protein AMR42_10725 [Limnothrix sp. PR1529]